MKNKSMAGLQPLNLLLILGMSVVLLVSASSSQMIAASSSSPNQEAINHINQAQSALQNGDTAGAHMHMDAAKQVLGCNKIIDPNC
jgi:hypothetical protein